MRGPDLERLDDAKVVHPCIEARRGQVRPFGGPEQGLDTREGWRERRGGGRFRVPEGVGTNHQPARRSGRRGVGEQHAADAFQQCGVAREPPCGVETRGKGNGAFERDRAVRLPRDL